MRAVVFEAPATDAHTTRVVRRPTPEPGPGQVAIDVAYAGVNFKDVMARRGDRGYVSAWPFVPGLEVAGVVRSVGPGVNGWAVGARVAAYTGEGGQAEVAIADAAVCVPVPDGLGLAPAAVACGALLSAELLVGQVARLRAGESVLVHGAAGGVGAAAARSARAHGAGRVLGTVGDAARLARVGAGYDGVLVRGPELVDDVRAHAPDGVDVILDPQGTALLELDLQLIAPTGRIVLFGNASGEAPTALPPLPRLMGVNASIAGFSLAALAARDPSRVADGLTQVLRRLAADAGTVELTVVEGLDGAAVAHQALAEGRGGKYVVRVGPDG
jgi:NADPH2:quinone reductase